jgi:chemotaxis-related protein WspB
MLLLILQVGGDRYAIDAERIVEVLPMVRIKPFPQASKGIAGLIDYRGGSVPVTDLSQCLYGRPANHRLSTRLIIVRHAAGESGMAALIVERATETIRHDPQECAPRPFGAGHAPHLGPVIGDAKGLIQRIDVTQLLAQCLSHHPSSSPAERTWTASPTF